MTTEAEVYLSAVAERPTAAMWDLVDEVGVVEAAARVRAGAVSGAVERQTAARRDEVDPAALLESGRRAGARFLGPSDPDWPAAAMADLDRPRSVAAERGRTGRAELEGVALRPFGLWWKGPAAPADVVGRSAALVGTRAPSQYGQSVAADLASGCALHDVAVVSGAAFGIDSAAHRGCLATSGVTVAVLACGVDCAYPRSNESLLGDIGRTGAVVSAYPPGTPVARFRFLDRNRLIAALSRASVVVEAGRRSGALSTAAWARNLGRPVGAVPGPVMATTSVGSNALLRDRGAEVVRNADDVLELAGTVGEVAVEPPSQSTVWDGLDDDSRRVLEAVPPTGGSTSDEIARDAGIAPSRTVVVLGHLTAAGAVTRSNDGFTRGAKFSGQLRLM